MESSTIQTTQKRLRRKLRVRAKLHGTAEKPRMCVVKTNKHIQVQLIDDDAGHTIAAISTLSKEFRSTEFNRKNKVAAHQLGVRIAELAKEKQIVKVIFDRGASKYHGVLAALADAARSNGLEF